MERWGRNQCFPASCVMFRDGWCADGSFSWSIRVKETRGFHSIYFPSSLTWFRFDFPAFRHWTAGGRRKWMFSVLVESLSCFLRDFQSFCFREYDFHPCLSFLWLIYTLTRCLSHLMSFIFSLISDSLPCHLFMFTVRVQNYHLASAKWG